MNSQSTAAIAWVAMALGMLGVVAGIRDNYAVLVLGCTALVLAVLALVERKASFVWWGIGTGAMAVLGYLGILAQSAAP